MKHGNEDTVREMLRIKRSVQATFNTQVNFMSAQMLAAASGQPKTSTVHFFILFVPVMLIIILNTAADLTAGDSMALLEAKAQQLAEEARKEVPKAKGGNISFVRCVQNNFYCFSYIIYFVPIIHFL